MKNKMLLLSVSLGAAAGAAFYFLKKKRAAAGPDSGVAEKTAVSAPKSVKEASYSFISGFRDAETVELRFSYDAERFQFAVVEEGFLTESGDSHVGLLSGEDFSVQFEYAGFYQGEDFAKLCQELSAHHPDLTQVQFGANSGLRYRAGDQFCFAFEIPDDRYSYLLVTLVKAKDNDDPIEAIADYADLRFILNSMSFRRS